MATFMRSQTSKKLFSRPQFFASVLQPDSLRGGLQGVIVAKDGGNCQVNPRVVVREAGIATVYNAARFDNMKFCTKSKVRTTNPAK